MILTRKRLPVDIFLTDCLSKSLAFYEFPSINFSPGKKIILEQQATTLNEQATQWLHYFRKQDWHSDVVRSGSVVI